MKRYGWLVFLVLGALILIWAADNAVFIPALDPADPERGWAWLTTDPEIIEYVKFNFRFMGMWQIGYGLLVISAAFGLRKGHRCAWTGLWSVPLVVVLLLPMMPWILPVVAIPFLAAIGTLLYLRPKADNG
jgi:hypothetical protein